jgi:23S rRNA pseudouridine1911/1915/1917 synthase
MALIEHFAVESETELDSFLFEKLPEVKRTNIRNLVRFRGITVNNRTVVRCNHALKPGDKVSVTLGQRKGAKPRLPPGLEIVYEDSAVLLVNKPEGLLTVATANEQQDTLHRFLDDYVQAGDRKGDGRVYLVHRLDRETSGLIIFAKTGIARRELKENWKNFEKRYLAVVEGPMVQPKGTISSFLDEDKSLRVYSGPRTESSKLAVTHFTVQQTSRRYSLLELILETGRKNQIRVHCADIGHPIVGDTKYGSKADPIKRIALHSYKFYFDHPVTKRRMQFTCDLPEDVRKLMKK